MSIRCRQAGIPFLTKRLIGVLNQFHSLAVQNRQILFLFSGLRFHMTGPLVPKPRALCANQLEARKVRPQSIIDVAEISEEPQVEDADTLDQRA